MTRNEFKTKAKWAIIEKLEEGYDGYLCDLHNEVFNTEMYETNAAKATRILEELVGCGVAAEIIKYEQDHYINATFPPLICQAVNMYKYFLKIW